MPPIIDKDKCIGCGKCFDVCVMDVFIGSNCKEVPIISYPEECWHCGACVMDCPVEGAIRLRIPIPAMVLFKPK
jgi:adenylylsulfate reductase subunit B